MPSMIVWKSKNAMKVCYVTHTFSTNGIYTGVDTYLHQLIQQMKTRADVTVYSGIHVRTGVLGRESEIIFDGVPVTRITTDYWAFKKKMGSTFGQSAWDKLVRDRFRAHLLHTQPDIVHIQHLLGLSDTLPQVLCELNIPFFFTVTDFYSMCPRVFLLKGDTSLCAGPSQECVECCWAWKRHLPPWSVRKATLWHQERKRVWEKTFESAKRIFTGSASAKKVLVYTFPFLEEKVEVCPPGIEELYQVTRHQRSVKAKGVMPVRVGYFGGIQKEKGVHLLCRAVAQMPRGTVTLDLFGYPRGHRSRLLLMKHRLHSAISFHGAYKREGLPELLASMDVVVVPSLAPETFCFVAHEALAAGVPLVVSDRGVLPDLVTHGKNGFVFEVDNYESLVDALRTATRSEESRGLTMTPSGSHTPAQHAGRLYQQYLCAVKDCASVEGKSCEVSVLVVNYNGKGYIRECLLSLRNQTFREFEVVVIDNGSSDGSWEEVEKHFPEVKKIKLPVNRGLPAALNKGIQCALGRYVAHLDVDAHVDQQWLARLYAAAHRHPEAGFFASMILDYHRPDSVDSAGNGFRLTGECAYHVARGSKREALPLEEKEVFGACACGAMYKKDALFDVGLFDEDFFHTFDDVDLDFRLQLRGHRCLFVAAAIVYHHGSVSRGADVEKTVYLTKRNMAYVIIKNVPAVLLLKYGHLIIVRSICSLLGSSGEGVGFLSWWKQCVVAARARMAVFVHLAQLLRKRRDVQRRRKVSIRYVERLLTGEY